MGLGSETPRNKMYYLNLRSKRDKKVDPHFTVDTKVDGNIARLKDETEISGQFLKISHGEYTWESERGPKKEKTVAVHLVDGEREFKIEMNINSSLARNVMNTLLSKSTLGWMVLRVYVKDGYPKIYIENEGESLGWAFEWKDNLEKLTEKVPDYENPGQEKTLYTKLNAYLLNAWIGHERVVNANARQTKPAAPPAENTGAPADKNVFAEKLAASDNPLQDEFDNAPDPNFPAGGDGPKDDKDTGSDDLPF